MFPSETRKGSDGETRSLREAVQIGVLKGWTVKETSFMTGWKTSSLQSKATRMKVSFGYGGNGPKPKYWYPGCGEPTPDCVC